MEALQAQLVEAATANATGALSDDLLASAQLGVLARLPRHPSPQHVPVLQKLKCWAKNELITPEQCAQTVTELTAASQPSATPAAAPAAPSEAPSQPAAAPAPAEQPSRKRKAVAGPEQVQKHAIVGALTRQHGDSLVVTHIHHSELKKQRRLWAENKERYKPKSMSAQGGNVQLPSESKPAEQAPVKKEIACQLCPRTFSCKVALKNHMLWHSAASNPKVFKAQLQPRVPYHCHIGGSIAAAAAGMPPPKKLIADFAAERAQREERRLAQRREAMHRMRERESRAEAAAGGGGEQRRGSARRRQYTAKKKLEVVEFFEQVRADTAIHKKVDYFEADARSRGVTYCSAHKWAKPAEKARLVKARGKEYGQTLVRVDSRPGVRRRGKYPEAEKEVFEKFKARRARGRKTSGRWLSVTYRKVCLMPCLLYTSPSPRDS